jgi:hypothetical protein
MKPILPFTYFIGKKFTKKILTIFCSSFLFFTTPSQSQCSAGYYQAVINWDNLDFFHNAGGWYNVNSPSTGQPFVTNTMEQTQKFALGNNSVTFQTLMNVGGTAAAYGDVTTHTGDVTGYTGADVHFIPTASQTIVLTFLNEVTNASFTLYDVDRSQAINVAAVNASSVAQTVTATTYATSGTSILSISGSPSKTATASTTSLTSMSDNRGTVTFSVAGPVKTITLTVSTLGSNAEFFFSDILSCVANPGFTSSYYATYTEPYSGQPAYFLANPDSNLNVYMVDPATATAHQLFSDPGGVGAGVALNSIAYDPINHYMYYVMNGATNKPGNRAVKKYDFNTNSISTIISDINSLLVPTFIQGVEASSAAFYDGSLYIGIEGTDASSFTTNTESVIWRIDFDGSGNATRASQVYGVPSDDGAGQPSHDWGDFVIKDGVIRTHASNQISPSYASLYNHVTMTTNTSTSYTGYADTAGQMGQIWNGTMYRIDNRVMQYNDNGTVGAATIVSVTSCSPSWNNKPANDASCPFRPKQDFGDAPATYDPVTLSAATHQRACNNSTLYIGTTWGDEWTKNTSADASGDDEEDGIGTVTGMVSDGNAYNHVQEVTVFNNTGANVYLAGWLDYDADGVFEASEIATATVPSSASPQTITLAWTGITVAIGTGDSFLRIRLSSTSLAGADATGWRADGEVEDYPVISSAAPLVIRLLDFTASLTKEKDVLLNWRAYADADAKGFEVQRSVDQVNWENIGWVDLNKSVFTADYSLTDQSPHQGRSYYRLKLVEKSGSSRYSAIRLIQIDQLLNKLKLYPNPANNSVTLSLNSTGNNPATLIIRSLSGQVFYKKTILLTDGTNLHNIDLNRMSNGLYVVEVQTNDSRYLNKLTVSR